MREELFQAVQDIAAPREEVFAFFSDPANLEALTPPWLAFEILTPAPLPLNRPVFLGQWVECIHAAAPVPRRS